RMDAGFRCVVSEFRLYTSVSSSGRSATRLAIRRRNGPRVAPAFLAAGVFSIFCKLIYENRSTYDPCVFGENGIGYLHARRQSERGLVFSSNGHCNFGVPGHYECSPRRPCPLPKTLAA